VWRWTGARDEIGQEMLPVFAEVMERLLAWQREGRLAMQYRGEFVELTRADLDDETLRAAFYCVRDPEGDGREIVEYLESRDFEQDPDVLDTWFSSALWPLNTMGWPDPDQSDQTAGLLDAFNPSDVLCTAREIITLWVSRMVMFNRYFLSPDEGTTPGRLPFAHVFIHAMIQDGEGRKMSKSLGNGVDPLDIIKSHGSDAMRFTLCKMTTQTQDVRMPVELDPETGHNTSPKFDEGRNFCTKLWNAARFALMKLESATEAERGTTAGADDLTLVDRWMLSRLRAVLGEVERAIAGYRFNEYAQSVYDLLWRDFCDWYLEAIKPTIDQSPAQRAVLHQTLDTMLRMLQPICPFITEEIWEALRAAPHGAVAGLGLADAPGGGMLCVAAWPVADAALSDPDAEATFERLRTLVEAIRRCRADHEVKSKERLTLHAGGEIVRLVGAGGGVVETLAGLEAVTDHPAGEGALEVPFEGGTVRLGGFEASVDSDAVRAQLAEQVRKLENDVGQLEKRLGNPGYVEKAPAKLVDETREQLRTKSAELAALRARLEEMG
jgi:valyl-tRNA synthetase